MTSSDTRPHDFLASFQRACSAHGYDFAAAFDWYFAHGYVFKGPDYLLLGGPSTERPDAWFVFWAECSPPRPGFAAMRQFVQLVPYRRPYVGWARFLKGRKTVKYYSTDRLMSFNSGTHETP